MRMRDAAKRRLLGAERTAWGWRQQGRSLKQERTPCSIYAETVGINPSVPDAFGQLFQAAVNAGHAEDDFAILSKFMREQMLEHSAKVSIA